MTGPETSGLLWRKSSHSANDTNCVEVAFGADLVAVRDSKHPTGPALTFSPTQWRAFLHTVDSAR